MGMIPQDKRTERRKMGDLGESLACEFLRRNGYEILDRNYLRKWGELDIVAKKENVIHFVEVKTVSIRPGEALEATRGEGGASGQGSYRPEDNVHPWKLQRLSRTMQTYLMDKNLDNDFQLDLVTVKLDTSARKGRVELIENVII